LWRQQLRCYARRVAPCRRNVPVGPRNDELDFADLTATFLERESDRFDVGTATSADKGMEILANQGVDCIVSDYDMPRTNGIEFLEAVRDQHPELPFILYTGKGSEEVAGEAISADDGASTTRWRSRVRRTDG